MSFWRLVSMILAALLVLQWILFSVVLSHRHDPTNANSNTNSDAATMSIGPPRPSETAAAAAVAAVAAAAVAQALSPPPPPPPEGVAVTLMLHAPKWFHRRYTVMLHNVLANIPDTWTVQVFVKTAWLEKDVLPLHPGLRSMYHPPSSPATSAPRTTTARSRDDSWTVGRVTWVPLPANMTRHKPKEIMKSTWLWRSVMAENVLLFGGNGAVCANSRYPLTDFLEFDYVGAPWTQYQGRGGDGSTHSFRHRSAMLSILQKYPPDGKKDDRPDYRYFIQHLLEEEEKESSSSSGGGGKQTMKVADRQTTMAFGGFSELDQAPFLLSGTQASLNWTMRDNILSTCPEIKVIFPSMHEPACFGAHPNGPTCKESICALQDQIPPGGC